VPENGVLRIFGPEWKEVAREWRKLLNEELHNLYSLLNIGIIKSRGLRWVGHVTHTREERTWRQQTSCKFKERYGHNIKMALKESDWQDADGTDLALKMFTGVQHCCLGD
jgi:hypothetical protein